MKDNIYLNEIGKYQVLTNEEEKELFCKIVNVTKAINDYEAKDTDSIMFLEYDNYLKNKSLYNTYINKLVNCNLKLVVCIAKEYENKGLPKEDLIQEGNMGLLHAIEKFDFEKGVKLSTYASTWIRQYIQRAIQDQKRTIRIPSHINEFLSKIYKAKERFIKDNSREPSIEELAVILDVTEGKILDVLNASKVTNSLDGSIKGHEDTTLGELVSDDENLSPLEKSMKKERTRVLKNGLNQLGDKEKEVILLRNGFYGRKYTLDEIGKMYNLTRERVRQIENAAIKKLRVSCASLA